MPMESRQENLFEVFNDCTLLLLTYHLWCFTDIVGEPETRYELGYVFIGASLGNISVHFVLMLLETFIRTKLACKKYLNRKKAQNRQLDQYAASESPQA